MKPRCLFLRMLGSFAAVLSLAGAMTFSIQAATVAFSWTQNSEADLAGYNLYYGPTAGNYTNHVVLGKVGNYTMSNLVNGATYYFALAAFNTNNVESDLTAPLRFPNPPAVAVIPNQTTTEDTPINVPVYVTDVDTSAGDLTLSATSSNLVLVPIGNITFSGTDTNRTMRIVPATNMTGTSSITVTVSDGVLTASRSFTLTVTPVNDPPSLTAIADVTTTQNVYTAPISFTVSDPDTALTNLTVRATSSNATLIPTNRIVLGGTGGPRTVVLQPATNQNGSATVTLIVSDGSLTASRTFQLTVVQPVNNAPSISAIPDVTTSEDVYPGAISFTVSDPDTAASNLTVRATSSNATLIPTNRIVLGGTGGPRTVVLQPATNQNGSATITLTVSDGALTASRTFQLTVNAVNDPPSISTIANVTTTEDVSTAPISFTVSDPDTDPTNLTVQAATSNATLIPTNRIVLGGTDSARTVVLQPATNQTGSATITLTVSDGASTGTRTFTLTVNPVNDGPSISAIADVTTDEDVFTPSISFTVSDPDTALTNLTVRATSSNATLIPTNRIVLGGTGGARTVQLRPATNQIGAATITLIVSDGALTASSSFQLTVVPAVNNAPSISAIPDVTTSEDVYPGAISFTVSDPDTAASNLTVSATSSNPTLIPTNRIVLGGTGGPRTVVLQAATNQTGSATITLTVSDGALTASRTFLFTVNAVNDPPSISTIANVTTTEDVSTAPISFTVSDPDTDPTNLTVTAATSNATLIPTNRIVLGGTDSARTVVLQPATNQNGSATITLTVSDGASTGTRTFTLTVNPVNDGPSISAIADVTTDEDVFTSAISFTVSDPDTAATSLTVRATSSNATLIPTNRIILGGTDSARTVVLQPATNQTGSATITLIVSDGALTASRSFQLTVVPAVNNAPSISAIPDVTTSEDVYPGAISFTVSDPDTAAGNLTVSATSGNPTLIPTNRIVLGGTGGTRTVVLQPATNQNGLATITLTVSDGVLTASRTFQLTVNAVNDPPSISTIANVTTAEEVSTPPISFTVSDPDTDPTNLTVTAATSNATLIPTNRIVLGGTGGARTVVLQPATNQNGSATITLTVSDGASTGTRTFTLTVNPANDGPSISAIADVTTDEDVFTPSISFTVSDPDTALTNLTVRATSSNPTLIPTNRIVLGGTGGARTVQLRPATNQIGSASISLIVSDGTFSASNSFNFTVIAVNDAPTITHITDRNLQEDEDSGPLAFTIWDVDTPLANLTVTASSSNTNLVPQANISLVGTSSNRTVQVRPATNASGSVSITLTVSDGQASTTDSFTINYAAVNDPPVVSRPPDLTVNKGNPVPPIPFGVWDAETAASALTITITSTNTTLLPTNRITLTGTGTNRSLTLNPVANQLGTTRVRILVGDGATNTQVGFQFTYTGSNNPPVVTVAGPFAGNAGAAIPVGGILVTDLDAGTNNLNVRITAVNGTVTVSTSVTGGIKASQVAGNNSAMVTIVAPQAALNATLTNANGATYTSSSNFSGTETLVVNANDNGFSGPGGAQSDTKNIIVQVGGANSLQRWRATYFTSADLQNPAKEATVWGDLADPDNDSRNNLMEFALGLNPLGSEPQEFALVSATVNSGGNEYLTLSFNSRINEPLLQYIVEVSADNATWSATAQRVSSTPVNAEFERVTYQDTVPITPSVARFIRLRVVENSP